MTTKHLRAAASKTVATPQRERMRSDQVENSAGGYSWSVDKFNHLRRFLVLGTAGGTYYIGQKKLTDDGLKTIKDCLAEDGRKTVAEIATISEGGRAPKNDYAIFALAACVAFGDEETKRYALACLGTVCRIGTHLFQFASFLNEFGCLTGRAKRRAFANWYANKPAEKLAYDVIKYRQREGWSHRDILRLSHPGSITEVAPTHEDIFAWVTHGETAGTPDIIVGFEEAQKATSETEVANLIGNYRLPREAIPTEFLKSPAVWQALLDAGMPMTAMIRNLGNMTKIGLLTSQSEATKIIVAALGNDEAIKKARVHPINVLFAMNTYASGGGFRGGGTWNPVTKVVDALDGAFYKSFGNVEPTGKRVLLALDVSGSMTWGNVAGTNLTPMVAEAAMALVTEAVEDDVEIMAFGSTFSPLDISSRMRLDDVIRKMSGWSFGGTDCSLPMVYAGKKNLEFDAFVVYTDSETWQGHIHPAQALARYRKQTGIDSKLIVVGMVSNGFTIADPKDAGMLDVVGFDTATPNIMSDFIAGRI
jgi:60 kDa SS-A/Ro ribonucleoprotein